MNVYRTPLAKAWLVLPMLVGMWLCPAQAAQSNGQFNVNITLQSAKNPALAKTGACRGSSLINFGATVTLVCSTDRLEGYRYVLQFTRAGEFIGYRESGFPQNESGPGTIASWRIIQLADRDYLEMLVGW